MHISINTDRSRAMRTGIGHSMHLTIQCSIEVLMHRRLEGLVDRSLTNSVLAPAAPIAPADEEDGVPGDPC